MAAAVSLYLSGTLNVYKIIEWNHIIRASNHLTVQYLWFLHNDLPNTRQQSTVYRKD